MTILITGSTGFIGSYVTSALLQETDQRLSILVRANSIGEAEKRLWKPLQLHMDFPCFLEMIRTRVDFYLGDLIRPNLGLDNAARNRMIRTTDSIIHLAAALNRKSAKVCFNVNLRGTLQLIAIARAANEHHGLRRFSNVSTTAVCGKRQDECVVEETSIDWSRDDYDPYARTKKFCEHMVEELLQDVDTVTFRPSTIVGDSRFPETIEFDMVRAFVILAHMPVLPFDPDMRHDIAPVDFVSKAIVTIHQKPQLKHSVYHLSSGRDSLTYRDMIQAMRQDGFRVPHLFVPKIKGPVAKTIAYLSHTPYKLGLSQPATLLRMFWPYLIFNTVFDNQRVKEELGEAPTSFSEYAYPLLQFAVKNRFKYPYRSWPQDDMSWNK